MAERQPILVWDVDDVLNPLTRRWFEGMWKPGHPGCRLDYGDLTANPPHELLGVGLEVYLASLDEFRLSREYGRMEPRPEVLEWFRRYGDRCRHIALTATPVRTAPGSAEWVLRHFGDWIRTYHVVPSRRTGERIPDYDRTKAEFLEWWGRGDILVDDSPANIEGARRAGLKTILVPQPWNGRRDSLAEGLRELTAWLS